LFFSKEACYLLIDDFDDMFLSRDPYGELLFQSSVFNSLRYVDDQLHVYVCLKKRTLDVLYKVFDCCFIYDSRRLLAEQIERAHPALSSS